MVEEVGLDIHVFCLVKLNPSKPYEVSEHLSVSERYQSQCGSMRRPGAYAKQLRTFGSRTQPILNALQTHVDFKRDSASFKHLFNFI
jgi:hypothetical protein